MKKYNYQDLFEYSIIKSKRKTVSIVIKAGGEVVVKAPSFLSITEITNCLERKAEWVVKKLPEMRELGNQLPVKEYVTGDDMLYMGQHYKLVRTESLEKRYAAVSMTKDSIIVTGHFKDGEQVKEVLEKWYRKQASAWMLTRVEYYKRLIGVEFAKVSFRSPRTRWGSCSSQNNIMLNWKLIMAPEAIIDYVICHELCHLIELNHSADFWALVSKYMPDWKNRREWLKTNGITLAV